MGGLLLDPVIARAAGAAVALILLLGAIDKLRDRELFAAVVENYRVLPAGVTVRAFALALPLAEIAAAVLLLWPLRRTAGAVLSVALLAMFAAAMALNLLRGRRDIDCGCGGVGGRQSLSWVLVARNGALALLAVAGTADGGTRELGWLDGFTATAATLALLALYVSFNQLGANAPKLQSLRRRAEER